MFDGTDDVVGGSLGGSMFDSYDPIVSNHLGQPSPLQLSASYVLNGLEGSLAVHIEVTDDVTSANNQVSFVIVEDGAHNQVNLARLMLTDEPFTLTAPGESVDIVRAFSLDSNWIEANLRIAVFVQSASSHAVLQAVYAEANYTAAIVIDPNPDGLQAGWQITGPNGYDYTGAGDQTLLIWSEGVYSVTWLPVFGWNTPEPNPANQLVIQDATVTFTGTYSGGPFTEITAGPLGDNGPGRGVAMVDTDGDGDLDIHVVNDNQPDRLLRNEGDGSFVDMASGVLADSGPGQAVIWADYDNDGDLDAFRTRYNEANQMLQNDGSASFTDVAELSLADAGPGCGAAWADYDNDGLTDLYLANDGVENLLLKNFGDMGGGFWLWVAMGGVTNDPGPGACLAWADYDNDGDLDLYLSNRFAPNKLYDNNGPLGFFDATGTGALADLGNGAGVAWGDYDNDGDLDLYLANDGMADRLFRNNNGNFSLVIGEPLSDLGACRGVLWGDFDNDADLDLYVTRYGEADLYMLNLGNNSFARVPLGWTGIEGNGCGAACGDYDDDGDLDVYVANDGQPNLLLRNEAPGTNHWLQVYLEGTTANAAAIGARVRVVAGGISQLREISGGSGYFSQNPLRVHFGLGLATTVDTLEVTWPGGEVQIVTQLVADGHHYIQQGGANAVDDPETTPAVTQLHPCYPNPFNPSTTIHFSLPETRQVSLKIYTLDGRWIATLVQEMRSAGHHEVIWNGRDDTGRAVASGTYVARLEAGGHQSTQHMVLVK